MDRKLIIYDRELGCYPVHDNLMAIHPITMHEDSNVTHVLIGPVLSWDKHSGVIETKEATYIPKRNNADTD